MQTPFDQRANNFDFIRMTLALLVIFSHSYPLGTGSEMAEPFNVMTRGQVTGGHIAVDCFFIISGFLITASYERTKKISSYLKKRFFRIYPAFLTLMVFALLVELPIGGGHVDGNSLLAQARNVVSQTVQLREFHNDGGFFSNPFPAVTNGSLWSISYEFWCYIGVILLGLSGLLRSKIALLVLLALLILDSVLFSIYQWTPGGSYLGAIFGYPPFWARLLPMYVSGVVFYRLRSHLSLKTSWILVALGLMVAATVVPHGWPLLFPLAGAYLVLVAAFHPAIRLHGWNRFGDFSYGTYLYAFPIQQIVIRVIGHKIPAWELFFLAAPLTVLCAAISWHGVEKWFLRSSHPVRVDPVSVAGGVAAG